MIGMREAYAGEADAALNELINATINHIQGREAKELAVLESFTQYLPEIKGLAGIEQFRSEIISKIFKCCLSDREFIDDELLKKCFSLVSKFAFFSFFLNLSVFSYGLALSKLIMIKTMFIALAAFGMGVATYELLTFKDVQLDYARHPSLASTASWMLRGTAPQETGY